MRTWELPMEEIVSILKLQMANGAEGQLAVVGTSMTPMLINSRDSVTLKIPTTPPKKGDIILYQRKNGHYVLHRIVGIRENGYFCCGDNQWRREPVNSDQIIAVLTGFERKGKAYTTEKMAYRVYTAFWIVTRPLRRPLLAILSLLVKWKKSMIG